MNHPEIIAVPVLMLADYTLTILGAKESAAVYREHFVIASYEMNPLWRKSVDQMRWFNPWHFGLVGLITALLIVLDQSAPPEWSTELCLGVLLGALGAVCGKHLANLLVFRFLKRHPEQISGQVNLSMRLALKMSQFSYLGLVPLFAINAILAPHPYTLGIALGVVVLAGVHSIWAWRARVSTATADNDA